MKKRNNKKAPNVKNKKRMLFLLLGFCIVTIGLIIRLGYIQILQGNDLKKQALEQWARDITINAKRGTIYDAKGKKLAVSINTDTVICFPQDVMKASTKKGTAINDNIQTDSKILQIINSISNIIRNKKPIKQQSEENKIDVKTPEEIAETLSNILEMDYEEVYEKITKNSKYVIVKKWITREQVEQIREADLSGINIIDDTKRVYPYENFASYILGFTSVDQEGLYGIESTYNKYLTGVSGRWVVNTDGNGRELPYGFDEYYEPQNGLSVVLTLDETIQHFAEKAAERAYVDNNALKATVLVMDPNSGDILAMSSKPDYDPNNPREPLDETKKQEWENLSSQELQKEWFDMWRNPIVNDIYEPGSTFKLVTTAIALEENKTSMDHTYYCDGYVREVKSYKPIKCWRYYNPHGSQTLAEALQNSCNDALARIGLDIGKDLFYKYLKALGFGEKTGIDLNGEASGIVNHPSYMKDVNVVTQSFGQGISVTPLQLVNAVSAIVNGGNLMEPRIVKELIDEEGNVIEEFEPVIKRKVFSEETTKDMLDIMESVVTEGSGKNAYIPGYSVGGKTGTAQKVIDGKYAEGKYVTSFIAAAPTYDPKLVVLMTIDEPTGGSYYGSIIAAPLVGEIINETLKYMDVEPQYTEQELGLIEKSYVEVPEVRGKTIEEASKLLSKIGLDHNITLDIDSNTIVKDQFPQPGTEVLKDSLITLMMN